ncbi:hypothetical protein BH11ACT4_BH11ACT4_11330 [soil metagenome]
MAQGTPPVPPADDAVPAVPAQPAPASGVPGAPQAAGAETAAAEPAAAPAAPAKRKIWPFILAGGLLLLVLLIVGVSVLVGTIIGTLVNGSSPSATVLAFDKSFKETDCTLFQKTTTSDFQSTYFDQEFTCDQWNSIATSLHDNGVYNYTVVVHDTKVSGDTADVTTTEKDTTPGGEQTYELDYRLVKTGGSWVIDGITSLGG